MKAIKTSYLYFPLYCVLSFMTHPDQPLCCSYIDRLMLYMDNVKGRKVKTRNNDSECLTIEIASLIEHKHNIYLRLNHQTKFTYRWNKEYVFKGYMRYVKTEWFPIKIQPTMTYSWRTHIFTMLHTVYVMHPFNTTVIINFVSQHLNVWGVFIITTSEWHWVV